MPDRSLQGTQPSCGLRAGLQTGPGWGGLGASDSRPLLLVFQVAKREEKLAAPRRSPGGGTITYRPCVYVIRSPVFFILLI